MKARNLLLGAVLALSAPIAANAGTTNGLYLGGAVGANFAPGNTDTADQSNKIKYGTGIAGAVSLGYGFGNGMRAEFETSIRNNDIRSISGSTSAKGSTSTYGMMVNGLYDINTGTAITPYVGGGVGVGIMSAKASDADGPLYKGTDAQFAYQGIAGVAFALTPNLSLTADYRYFATTAGKFKEPGSDTNKSDKVTNGNHTVMAGVRWAFDAPASR